MSIENFIQMTVDEQHLAETFGSVELIPSDSQLLMDILLARARYNSLWLSEQIAQKYMRQTIIHSPQRDAAAEQVKAALDRAMKIKGLL